MAKLHATLTSDKTARTVSKSGNKYITITLHHGNAITYKLQYYSGNLSITNTETNETIDL